MNFFVSDLTPIFSPQHNGSAGSIFPEGSPVFSFWYMFFTPTIYSPNAAVNFGILSADFFIDWASALIALSFGIDAG